MKKDSIIIFTVLSLLLSACVRHPVVSTGASGKSAYRSVRPGKVLKSVRPVYDSVGSLPSEDPLDFSALPTSNAELRAKCQILEERGLQLSAMECLEKVLQREPESKYDVQLRIARLALQSGDPETALRKAQDVSLAHPESEQPLTVIASAYISMNQPKAARDALLLLLRKKPDQPFALLELGELLYRSGDYQGAIETLHELLGLEANPQAEELLAEAYLEAGNEFEAVRILQRLRGSIQALQRVGGFYLRKGLWKDARHFFEQIKHLDPENSAARINLSRIDSRLPRASAVTIGPFGSSSQRLLAQGSSSQLPDPIPMHFFLPRPNLLEHLQAPNFAVSPAPKRVAAAGQGGDSEIVASQDSQFGWDQGELSPESEETSGGWGSGELPDASPRFVSTRSLSNSSSEDPQSGIVNAPLETGLSGDRREESGADPSTQPRRPATPKSAMSMIPIGDIFSSKKLLETVVARWEVVDSSALTPEHFFSVARPSGPPARQRASLARAAGTTDPPTAPTQGTQPQSVVQHAQPRAAPVTVQDRVDFPPGPDRAGAASILIMPDTSEGKRHLMSAGKTWLPQFRPSRQRVLSGAALSIGLLLSVSLSFLVTRIGVRVAQRHRL